MSFFSCRSQSFKEDDGTWKGNDDGKVVNNQPQRVMDDRNGMMAQAGYIGRFVIENKSTQVLVLVVSSPRSVKRMRYERGINKTVLISLFCSLL